MHGASFPHATTVRGAPLTRFAINVETRAQAQAIQTFLWCLWLSALHQTRSGYATEVKHATTGQSYWKVDVGGRNDDGQLKLATLGGILTVNPSYSGDGLGRINTVNVTSGSNPLLAQTFDFESVGNLKGRSLTGTSGGTTPTPRSESENFAYDTLDRLLQTSGTGITDAGSNAIDLAGKQASRCKKARDITRALQPVFQQLRGTRIIFKNSDSHFPIPILLATGR